MSIVIVGANGFLGAHFAARLADSDDEVDLVTNTSSWRPASLSVERTTVPLEDVRWHETDWVFVLAGSGRPQPLASHQIPTVGNEWSLHKSVLTHIAQSGRSPSVVMASSRTVYGRPDQIPVGESAALRPATGYAAEKVFIEQLYAFAARDLGIASMRLRITNPFGPLEWNEGRGHGLLSQFAKQAVDTGLVSVYGAGRQLRDYVHVGDVSDLLHLIASGEPLTGSRALNVGSGEGTAIADLARLVAETAGADVRHVESPSSSAAIESGDFVADIELARSLGWSPALSSKPHMAAVAVAELNRLATGNCS